MRAIDADAFKDYIRGACEEMKHLYKDNGAWAKEITESFCKDIDEQPTIQPEIIHCKDCRKHNKKLGFDENYNITYKADACPLIPWRGMSKGHEHDYQSCCFGEMREVTE